MFNSIILYWGHLTSSKKSLMISTIGLIFALAILGSSILYINTEKVDIINEMLNTSNSSPYEVEIDLQTQDLNISFQTIHDQIDALGKDVMNITQINFMNSLELFYSIQGSRIPEMAPYYNTTTKAWSIVSYNRSLIIMELNNGIKSDLAPYLSAKSSLPSNSDSNSLQGFLLNPYFGSSTNPVLQQLEKTNVDNYSSINSINIYQSIANFTQTIPMTITGYGKFISYDVYSNAQNQYVTNYDESQFPTLSKAFKIVPLNLNSSYLFVNNLTATLSYFHPLYFDSVRNISLSGVTVNINGGYKINYDKFDPFTISSKIDEIKSLSTVIQDKIFDTPFYKNIDKRTTTLNLHFIDYSKLSNILNLIFQIIYEMMLYAIPMLLIAMLVTNYSFGLIQNKILSHVGIYKTRGASSFNLFVFQVLDYAIVVLVATVVGMLLEIPVTDIVTKTNGLLNFTNTNSYDVFTNFLTILPYMFVILFIASIIIGFIISIRKIIRLSRITINESESNTLEKAEPFWKIHYLDVYIFLYGLLSYFVITYIFSNPVDNGLALEVGIFFLIFFLPGPFAIVIGTILIANRIIPKILEIIGSNLWYRTGDLFAFSFKNVIRHKQSSTRAIILIASLITFLILFYAIPSSQIAYASSSSQYSLGAQAQVIYPTYFQSDYLNQKVSQMQNQFSTYIKGITPVMTLNYYSNLNNNYYTFIFINTTSYINGSSVSLFNLGLSHSLKGDLKQLPNNSTSDQIIVPANFLSTRNSKVGQNVSLDLPGGFHQFSILDSYNEWPMTTRNQLDPYHQFLILDINTFYNLSNLFFNSGNFGSGFNGINTYFLINFYNIEDVHPISQQISLATGNQVNEANLNLQWWDTQSQLIFQFRLGQINIDVVMSLIIAVTILLMFAYMQMIERREDIFTERGLGIKLSQMALLFYVESVILLLSGVILGSIISFYFIQTLTIFITGGVAIPSYVVILPLDLVGWTYILLFVVVSLCAIIPAYYLSKQDIIRSFKADN